MKIIKHFNYSEFKNYLDESKRISDPLWCRFVYRPLSLPTGWFIYRIGIKANSVSLFSILLTLISSIVIVFGNSENIIAASLLLMLVALSDCIDGNVARARGESGLGGEWMDAFSGYTVYALIPLSLGIHMFLNNPYEVFPGLWIILGSLTSIANLYLRLLYQKFVNCKLEEATKKKIKSEGSIFSKFSSEMGLVGWMMPTLLVAEITNMLGVYLAFYCFFYLVSAIITSIILVMKLP
jgi:phosphatidylglycerophosphate synthase